MRNPFVLTIILFLFIGLNVSHGQCDSSIKYKVTKATTSSLGSIDVTVTTPKNYSCYLYSVTGKGKTELKRMENINNQKVSFDELKPGFVYRVLFQFSGEENELICRERQISGITVDAN